MRACVRVRVRVRHSPPKGAQGAIQALPAATRERPTQMDFDGDQCLACAARGFDTARKRRNHRRCHAGAGAACRHCGREFSSKKSRVREHGCGGATWMTLGLLARVLLGLLRLGVGWYLCVRCWFSLTFRFCVCFDTARRVVLFCWCNSRARTRRIHMRRRSTAGRQRVAGAAGRSLTVPLSTGMPVAAPHVLPK